MLVGKHDGEYAPRHGGIGRVRRVEAHVAIVVGDLPVDRPAAMLERAEIVLVPRVVILAEVIERAHAIENDRLLGFPSTPRTSRPR